MNVGDNTYGHIWIPALKRTYVEGFQQIIQGMCSSSTMGNWFQLIGREELTRAGELFGGLCHEKEAMIGGKSWVLVSTSSVTVKPNGI